MLLVRHPRQPLTNRVTGPAGQRGRLDPRELLNSSRTLPQDPNSQEVALRAWRRWDAALRRRGLDSTPVRGVDSRRIVGGDDGLAGYFVKAATELTASWAKDSRTGRSPFAIARDAVETYLAKRRVAVVGVRGGLPRPEATHLVDRPPRPPGLRRL